MAARSTGNLGGALENGKRREDRRSRVGWLIGEYGIEGNRAIHRDFGDAGCKG